MKTKLFIAVEYLTEDENTTFEIFESIEEAYSFAKTVQPIEIFVADFDESLVYKEDDGQWNYDEFAGLWLNSITIDKYEQ